MKFQYLVITIFIFLHFIKGSYQSQIFVTPLNNSCGTFCSGDITKPYGNFFDALQSASLKGSQSTIILLYSESAEHFAIGPGSIYDEQGQEIERAPLILSFTDLEIRPLFCDESMVQNNSSLRDKCISRDQKLTVYLKTIYVYLEVSERIMIQNIIFDGIEAIFDYRNNKPPAQFGYCYTMKGHCCPEKNFTIDSDSSLQCNPENSLSMFFNWYDEYKSFIKIPADNTGVNPILLTFLNMELRNFWGPVFKHFIETNYMNDYNLTFDNCTFDDFFFDEGLVWHYGVYYQNRDYPDYMYENAYDHDHKVVFKNIRFMNYNNWKRTSGTGAEGYLFFAEYFNGDIQIIGSIFENINTASKEICALTEGDTDSSTFYIHNQFMKYPGPKTDIWYLYRKEYIERSFYNEYSRNSFSSLVLILTLYGKLSVENSNFNRIIGIEGSVINIDDCNEGTECSLFCRNNTFNNNAAMLSFSNIIIKSRTKKTIEKCPLVRIENCTFANSHGCPGAYGNVGIICGWAFDADNYDSSYKSFESFEISFSRYNILLNFDLSQMEPQVLILNSKFEKNLLSISNSIAILGSYYTSLVGNIFQDNGGTTGEIIKHSLNQSYLLQRKPNQPRLFDLTHFGQSSVLNIDKTLKIELINNTFQRNWGPFDGSESLGVCLTIKNWISLMPNTLIVKNNDFLDHWGIPPDIAQGINDEGLRQNSFTPSLITISFHESAREYVLNLKNDSSLDRKINIIFEEVKFKNNTMSFDVVKGCTYNAAQMANLCSQMSTDKRFKTGLVRLTRPSENSDNSGGQVLYDGAVSKIGMTLTDTEVSNNKILTQGCLFSTFWVNKFLLQHSDFHNNLINPFADYTEESLDLDQPSLSSVSASRSGLVCGYQSESVTKKSSIQILLSNANVFDNVGTLVNLFPSESCSLLLTNSVFSNNRCPHGSSIQVIESSSVSSINNIFNQNNNPFGLFLVTSTNIYNGFWNTYLRNRGKHACFVYIKDKIKSFEYRTKAYWNTISPTYQTFIDQITPQGGLYYSISAEFVVVDSVFAQNEMYAGLIISLNNMIWFDSVNITDHHYTGFSILGNFLYSSTLNVMHVKIINNSLAKNLETPVTPAFLIFVVAKFSANDLEVSHSTNHNIGSFISGMNLIATLKDVILTNFKTIEPTFLIILDFSRADFENLACTNITSIFKSSKTTLKLTDILIKNLSSSKTAQLLVNMIDTVLSIQKLEYIGDSALEDSLSLFFGGKNSIKIVDAYFLNALPGKRKFFELTESSLIFISRSVFAETDKNAQSIIFEIKSTQRLNIEDCTFVLPGRLIQAENNLDPFYFISNTILTNSHIENIKIIGSEAGYFLNNQLLRQGNDHRLTTPESQLHIINSNAHYKISNNAFMSLYSSKGVIEIQGLKKPYNVSLNQNIFIDNTGCRGGAIHLDASLSSTYLNLSTAYVENSVFISNRAINLQDIPAKGGAIYQTTSNLIKQVTVIRNNMFIKNSADTIGGAIFFDYIPPKIDQLSKFKDNHAVKPNHIGSYPIKLGYYGAQLLQEREPYLPHSPSSSRLISQNESSYKWENISCGLSEYKPYNFALLDMFDQTVYDDNSSLLELYPEGISERDRSLFSTKLSVQAVNGIYTFSNFIFTYKVGTAIKVNFKSTAISQEKLPSDLPSNPQDSVAIEVSFRECGMGESVSILPERGFQICMLCLPGSWQTNPKLNISSCSPCNEESTICLGGKNVGPRKGYWRFNDTADIVLQCPRPSSCLGNEVINQDSEQIINPRGDCEYGYTGNLCSNCIEGRVKTDNGVCINCDKNSWYYIRAGLTILFQVGMITQGVRGTRVRSQSHHDQPKNMNSAILIRVITNYFQLIALVSGMPVTWSNVFKSISSTISEISSVSENLFTLDCLLVSGNILGISATFFKLLLATAGGFIFALIGILFWVIYFIIKKKPIINNKKFVDSVVTTIIVILYMMQPTAIVSAFSFFQCSNLYREDNPLYFLKKDYDVGCWQGNHMVWTLAFAFPFLLIWSIFLPLTFYLILRRNRMKLNSPKISQKYSFLYAGYKTKKYYWELIIIIRKFLFIGVNVAASFHSTSFEIYIFVFLIVLAYAVHVSFQPYTDPRLNALERLSLLSTGIVNFCGLYFQLFDPIEGLDTFFIVCGLAGNLIFLIPFSYLYLKEHFENKKENGKFHSTTTRFMEKLCCCLIKSQKLAKAVRKFEQINELILSDTNENTKFITFDKTDNSSPCQDKKIFYKIKHEKSSPRNESKTAIKFEQVTDLIFNDTEENMKFRPFDKTYASSLCKDKKIIFDRIKSEPSSFQKESENLAESLHINSPKVRDKADKSENVDLPGFSMKSLDAICSEGKINEMPFQDEIVNDIKFS